MRIPYPDGKACSSVRQDSSSQFWVWEYLLYLLCLLPCLHWVGMRLLPSKENHSFNTQLLVGKSSETGHFLWQFSSLKNLMGFFYLSSWAGSSSWDTDLSIFHLAAGLCVLLTAPLLRSSDEWHIPSSLKWGTTQIRSLSQLYPNCIFTISQLSPFSTSQLSPLMSLRCSEEMLF